jgi:hypothetical protein
MAHQLLVEAFKRRVHTQIARNLPAVINLVVSTILAYPVVTHSH